MPYDTFKTQLLAAVQRLPSTVVNFIVYVTMCCASVGTALVAGGRCVCDLERDSEVFPIHSISYFSLNQFFLFPDMLLWFDATSSVAKAMTVDVMIEPKSNSSFAP